MTRDEITKLARKAHWVTAPGGMPTTSPWWDMDVPALERFAAMVAAAEREQCALTAWEIVQYEVHADLADQVAQAIRARGQASTTRMCPSTYYECQRGCGEGGCKDFEDAHQRRKA